MTLPLFLSRARLRSGHGETLSAIAPILMPDDGNQRAALAHRLVWLLFQDVPNAKRDFLWRDDGAGKYLILSTRPPADPKDLFELDTKPFAPALQVGDDLRFVLRANPTVARKGANDPDATGIRQRGKRVDVVMDRLAKLPISGRAQHRDRVATEAGSAWLTEQGARAGFTPKAVVVGSYRQIDIADRERKRRRERGVVSVIDLEGVLTVSDPPTFFSKLATGFGSAKAFGNGLMLLRRV
ncbi:MAG: type I-E CRISPR-associated protein Cas6/Cse3/CasE [Hyphomicrobium sp.]|nr:type I-E CRISPR-associated protein Cas6/Cse3/CasE [Hyphomicrobium sp.]